MAVGPDAGDRLLADVATLGEADGPVGAVDLLGQVRLVDVAAVDGRAGFHAQQVVDRFPGRVRPGGGERVLQRGGLAGGAHQVEAGQAQRVVPADVDLR